MAGRSQTRGTKEATSLCGRKTVQSHTASKTEQLEARLLARLTPLAPSVTREGELQAEELEPPRPPPPTHTPERLFNPSPLHKEQESTRSVCLCLPHIRTRPSDLGEEEVIGGS